MRRANPIARVRRWTAALARLLLSPTCSAALRPAPVPVRAAVPPRRPRG